MAEWGAIMDSTRTEVLFDEWILDRRGYDSGLSVAPVGRVGNAQGV